MKREKFLVLDTETCNTIEQPLPYDIGWAICDKYGNIIAERSFVVAETFLDMQDVMSTAYYAEKLPQYWEDIKGGKRQLKRMWSIRRAMLDDIKAYNIKKIGAYNMGFDKRALNNLMRYVSKSWCRWWFPFGVEFFCIWNMACSTILNRSTYIKFAEKNNLVSKKNNIQTSAESAYKYIKKLVDFKESHTGLEDVRIEVEIMAYCFRQHKKMDREINSACWMKVQSARKYNEIKAILKERRKEKRLKK